MPTPLKLGGRGDRVKPLQHGINKILEGRGFPWRKVEVDGVAGPTTFKSAGMALWLIGASRDQVNKVTHGRITPRAYEYLTGEAEHTGAMKQRDRERHYDAKKLRELHAESQREDRDGVASWRGETVAAWMVGRATGPDGSHTNWLQKSVDHGWSGQVNSGYRTPEYSEGLCRQMCGAPSCSGTCAGRSSNHSGKDGSPPGWGAIDVGDYDTFAAVQKQIGSPLWNNLSRDRVHFSTTGV